VISHIYCFLFIKNQEGKCINLFANNNFFVQKRIFEYHLIFFALIISLFPGGPAKVSTTKPNRFKILLTSPLAQ
jgi:hypothetical protein